MEGEQEQEQEQEQEEEGEGKEEEEEEEGEEEKDAAIGFWFAGHKVAVQLSERRCDRWIGRWFDWQMNLVGARLIHRLVELV